MKKRQIINILFALGIVTTLYTMFFPTKKQTIEYTTTQKSNIEQPRKEIISTRPRTSYGELVGVVKRSNVETKPPQRLRPSNSPNIYDRLPILPTKGDQEKELYLIIPYLGLIAPIIPITKGGKDRQTLTKNGDIDREKYLTKGVSLHPNSAENMNGNTIIAGHSSHRKDTQSDYKTIFTKLPELIAGDQIRIYKKINNKQRRKYTYETTNSFSVTQMPSNFLRTNTTESIVTLYTCIPIGTTDRRRIIWGRLLHEEELLYE